MPNWPVSHRCIFADCAKLDTAFEALRHDVRCVLPEFRSIRAPIFPSVFLEKLFWRIPFVWIPESNPPPLAIVESTDIVSFQLAEILPAALLLSLVALNIILLIFPENIQSDSHFREKLKFFIHFLLLRTVGCIEIKIAISF